MEKGIKTSEEDIVKIGKTGYEQSYVKNLLPKIRERIMHG